MRTDRSASASLPSVSDDARLARDLSALAHETRLDVLRLLMTRDRLSPRQATDLLDRGSLGSVSYHFNVMAESGLIRQTHVEPVRGAVQHFYTLTQRGRALGQTLLD